MWAGLEVGSGVMVGYALLLVYVQAEVLIRVMWGWMAEYVRG